MRLLPRFDFEKDVNESSSFTTMTIEQELSTKRILKYFGYCDQDFSLL